MDPFAFFVDKLFHGPSGCAHGGADLHFSRWKDADGYGFAPGTNKGIGNRAAGYDVLLGNRQIGFLLSAAHRCVPFSALSLQMITRDGFIQNTKFFYE